MVNVIRRYKQHAFILAGIFLVGVILTAVAVWSFERSAFRMWQISAVADAKRMTTELTYRVEREREPLISLATLYEGSNDVTQQELSDAYRRFVTQTGHQAPLALAWVAQTGTSYRIAQSAGTIPWLAMRRHAQPPEPLLLTLRDASANPNTLMVGPLFKRNDTSYLVMALAARNGQQDGVLITITNFDDILQLVTDNLLKAGTTLEVFHPATPDVNYSKLPPLATAAEADFTIADQIGDTQWRFHWLFDADNNPDYENGSFIIVTITGLSITILATLAFAALLFQNTRIEKLVATRTYELRKTFKGLQRAETQLVKQERMAALGSLVAGVAHELSTPISNAMMASSVVIDKANALAQKCPDDANADLKNDLLQLTEAANLVNQNTWRAGELISSFKQVSIDQTSAQRRYFNLRETVQQVVTTLGPQSRKGGHQLQCNVPDNIDMNSYPGQLGQVLTNLLVNAMVHGYQAGNSGLIQVNARLQDETSVEITVTDDGCGMPDDIKTRVFEPFFTTKLGQGGSGLGLHISYNIVDTVLGGSIDVVSEINKGTQFIIRVPLTAPEAKT